MTLNVEF